ncbi:MAG: DUF2807 domain-containing protein [Bacteroidales bacterium]|nr:DUF2807 domain-containing protein [Bacteroidales bacterium]
MKKILLLSSLSLLIFSACHDPFGYCTNGNNVLVSETRFVSGFNEIVSEGDYEVNIVQGDEYSVVVEAEENLMPYIETDLDNSTLVIRTKRRRCIDPNYRVKVWVSAPEVKSIILSGSGNINAEQIETNFLNVKISGSGDIVTQAVCQKLDCSISGSGNISLMGSCDEGDMHISSSGNINGYGMEQITSFATISGSGDMYLSVIDFLDVKITGSGCVNYIGNPAVTAKITGSGSVNNKN